jgi:hypothetical protein
MIDDDARKNERSAEHLVVVGILLLIVFPVERSNAASA